MLFLVKARLKDDPTLHHHLDALRHVQMTTVTAMAADGSMKLGGGLFDQSGLQRGNMAVVRFDTWQDAQDWAETHPFNQHGLWQSIEITELKCPPVFDTRNETTDP